MTTSSQIPDSESDSSSVNDESAERISGRIASRDQRRGETWRLSLVAMPRGEGRDLRNDESVTLVGEAVEEIPVPTQRPDAERPGEDSAEEERHRERRTNLRGGESEPEPDGGECEVEPLLVTQLAQAHLGFVD
jgi:hypothetical protein